MQRYAVVPTSSGSFKSRAARISIANTSLSSPQSLRFSKCTFAANSNSRESHLLTRDAAALLAGQNCSAHDFLFRAHHK